MLEQTNEKGKFEINKPRELGTKEKIEEEWELVTTCDVINSHVNQKFTETRHLCSGE